MRIRSLILLVILQFAGVTQAATVTIDFSDPAIPDSGITGFVTQGFQFSFFPEPIPAPPAYIAMRPGLATCPGCNLAMESAVGEAFNLLSMSVNGIFTPAPTMDVTGFFSGGGSQTLNIQLGTTTQTYQFNWNNLMRVEFDNLGEAPMAFNSINVSQVPVPAAAWLMLSALGALGWIKRRL